jgi:lipoprotein-anchoring transpeptidase ErfK/SrfK
VPRRRTLALRVAAVLACAAVGLVVRAALQSGGGRAGVTALPGRTAPAPTAFDAAAAQSRAIPGGTSVIATAKDRSIVVRDRPGHGRRRLAARRFHGRRIPLTFLVRSRRPGWLEVDLPTRPNHATGWVRPADVRLTRTRMRIVVHLGAHRLELRDGRRSVLRTRIAVGKALSPTPHGRYFVTDLVRPPDPAGFYGPYALGLSAHSSVYTSFEGGDGQVGIHGTNRPGAIGSDVSHGCIRVDNRAVTRLAARVPLGTPVDIRA